MPPRENVFPVSPKNGSGMACFKRGIWQELRSRNSIGLYHEPGSTPLFFVVEGGPVDDANCRENLLIGRIRRKFNYRHVRFDSPL